MSVETRALIAISIHLIGAIITLIIFYKTGIFEDAVKNGDGIRKASPTDVVFHALLLWELHLLLCIAWLISALINNFFYKKYNENKEDDN